MNIVTVGFRQDFIAEGVRQGLTIPLAIYHGKWKVPIPGTDAFTHKTLHTDFADSFAPDLPRDVAETARREGFLPYLRAYYRYNRRKLWRSESWLDVNNHFENAVQYFWNLIRDRKIDLVLFHDIPHSGSAIVLYHLAHAAGIKVLILRQSHFPEFFWAVERVEDLGMGSFVSGQGAEIPIDENPVSPFYMHGKKKMSRSEYLKDMTRHGLGMLGSTLILEFLWHYRGYRKAILRMSHTHRKYKNQKRYQSSGPPPSLDEKFVYFPLHYQPEMTTDIIGGPYFDQVRAIEEVARALPDDILIYVKENPQQAAYMRDESFFTRLKAIPSVRLVPLETSTFDLIHKSVAVTTITGTAGWEAVQTGKPVICFGNPWYRGLPGIFEWRKNPETAVADALAFTPDRAAFAAAVQDMATRLWGGAVDKLFADQVEGLDVDANNRKVIANTRLIIEQLTSESPSPALSVVARKPASGAA